MGSLCLWLLWLVCCLFGGVGFGCCVIVVLGVVGVWYYCIVLLDVGVVVFVLSVCGSVFVWWIL